MLRKLFISLTLPLLSSILPLHGLEAFRPEPLSTNNPPPGPLAFGDTWVAYLESYTQVRVVDRASRQIVTTLDRPADNTPVAGKPDHYRSVGNWAELLVADGDRLAVLCNSAISHTPPGQNLGTTPGMSVFVWEIPSGQLIGVADIDISPNSPTPFTGLSGGRLLVADVFRRKFLQWNADTLAPLPELPIPTGFPDPGYADSSGTPSIAMAGPRVAYRSTNTFNSLDLIRVDLATGDFARLPLPAGITVAGSVRLMMSADGLVCVGPGQAMPGVTSGDLLLVHYDLANSTVAATTTFPAEGGPYFGDFSVMAADGSWRVLAHRTDGTSLLVAGSSAQAAYQSAVVLPRPDGSDGADRPAGLADGNLWFLPASPPSAGVRALLLKAGNQADTHLQAEVLPCQESDGVLRIKVTARPAPEQAVTFRIRTHDRSATSPADFTAINQMETLGTGVSEKIIEIPVTKDSVLEPNESLVIELTDLDPHLILWESRFSAVIRGTSFDLLSPVAPFSDGTAMTPSGVFLAGGHLIQANKAYDTSSSPALLRRPFGSGDWQASATWNRPIQTGIYDMIFRGHANGLALFRDRNEATLYDPAADHVLFRLNNSDGSYNTDIIGDSHFFSDLGEGPPKEYELAPPHTARTVVRPPDQWVYGNGTYTTDRLLILSSSGAIESYSRADGSFTGLLFPSGPWGSNGVLASDGNLVAVGNNPNLGGVGKIWLFSMDAPGEFIETKGMTPASEFSLAFAGGYLFVSSLDWSATPRVDVIEPSTGIVIDTLFRDFAATVLERSPIPAPRYDSPEFRVDSFAVEGNRAVALMRDDTARIARFSRAGLLPSLATAGDVREGDSALVLSLTEAAPWPLTVTTRAVVAGRNQGEDWVNSGATVVVPAGATNFETGLYPFDDHLPEVTDKVALEVTITGNGTSEVRRITTRIADNDMVMLADVPHSQIELGRAFATVSGAWAYRPNSAYAEVSWTGQPPFTAATPYDYTAVQTFGDEMAGSGDWLALTQGTWGGNFSIAKPSAIFLYKPAVQSAPLRILKGMKWTNNFGSALFARGDSLWVGAPGYYAVNGTKKISVAGAAFEYHMPTGKKVRTFKAPKDYSMNFGSGITANAGSVWIASPAHLTRAGAVLQYSRTTGKWQRTIPVTLGAEPQLSGDRMTANADTVVLISQPSPPASTTAHLRGHSATSGALSWTITAPDDKSFSAVEMIRDDLLVAVGSSLYFYRLAPGAEPVLLLEIRTADHREATKVRWNGRELAVMRGLWSDYSWTSIDPRGLPQLAEFFPATAAAMQTAVLPTEAQPLALSQTPGGWTLVLPESHAILSAGESLLDISSDLQSWQPVARLNPSGAWEMLPDHGLDGATLSEGGLLNLPPNAASRFFRIRSE